MRKIRSYRVQPSLPKKLEALRGLANNLWWSWNPTAFMLWRRMDPKLWNSVMHNPSKLLGLISQSRLNQLSEDDGFINHMHRVIYSLNEYMESKLWFQKAYKGHSNDDKIAYFSAEYGITESLPIYSGGLGILAGDHLKSASDLGLPLVGVGLLYQLGYFRQYLNSDGWQQESYVANDFFNMPIFLERDEKGNELKIKVLIQYRDVYVRIWRAQVGRTPLFLLDTNVPENDWKDRAITNQLYGGDQRTRIEQEIVLGMGGIIALDALGIRPKAYHMNEGHSAFLVLERIRKIMRTENMTFNQAKEEVIASSVFTTHTPVPAGNDMFSPNLIMEYFDRYIHSIGISEEEFLGLGRQNSKDSKEPFCMTVLAMRLSLFSNGVSELHSVVSRKMWSGIYKGLDLKDVPIKAITNGVHIRSWLSDEMWNLFDRYLGSQWVTNPSNDSVWNMIDDIPDSELWRSHEIRRERLVSFARNRLRQQMSKRGDSAKDLAMADEVLNPETLTIGFARRFATYKRANLLFHDIERLIKIVNSKDKPVQIIMAGKAHPKDNEGKTLIKDIIHLIREEPLRGKIVFVEDYDINVARYMVQGVDVWLNTPRRPMEASGTSGMKASANGALNFSVLDGWWCEGYARDTGWAIGSGEDYEDIRTQDMIESKAMYDILENDIVPLFYDRTKDGLPRGWIKLMKSSLSKLNIVFNTNRMVRNYTSYFYIPAINKINHMLKDGNAIVQELASWKESLYRNWQNVLIEEVRSEIEQDLSVGESLIVTAKIRLGELKTEDLMVDIYYGHTNVSGDISDGTTSSMVFENMQDDLAVFKGSIPLVESGEFGFAVRILPNHPDLYPRIEPGFVHWSNR